MILTFYRFLPLGNAILSNLAKNTGSSDVEGDRKVTPLDRAYITKQ